uniref:Uncharacterized protein n=1 Tax=Caenorhabditis japonica TaxID=281687 RepID=A0A8R1HTP5_CAEJA
MRKDVPSVEEVVQIVEKMCQKTMKMKGGSIIFNVDPIFPCFHQFFSLTRGANLVKVHFDEFSVLLQQFRLLFHELNVSESELISIRKVFLQFFIEVSIDLITTTLAFDNHGNIHVFLKTTCFFNGVYFDGGCSRDLIHFSYVSKINVENAQRATTPITVSLWLSIPCTGRQHLLEHVFEDGLLQLLPENVKEFLTVWMISVRKQMRSLLKNSELLSTAEKIFDRRTKGKRMELNDEKVEEFLVQICKKVMNSKESFQVFSWQWAKGVMKKINSKNDKPTWREMLMTTQCDTPATRQLSALFSDTKSDSSLLAHLLFQLLCFLTRFSYHTIRHVFKFTTKNKSLIYDGVLEEEITDFEEIIEYEKEKAKESTPAHLIIAQNPLEAPKTPLVHVIRPRKTLLPTPTLEGVPAVRVPRPELYPNMPPHHCVPLPQNYSISPSSEPKIKLEPAFSAKKGFIFTPMLASPLSLPSIASKREPSEPNLSCEVTEEELKSARALRTPSEVSGSLLNRLNDDEGLAEKVVGMLI